ncbi:hypothetical protein QQS21_008125 [Conoideocrella luteorostrata]|uniref:Uncharacterized protein n=1 Tax=Conoideocrella luteorostrata TaxID=1105319 RepID=A0AAJ0CNU8_9HYPO|nr:hypothetical protein QQS21_008125 [Conoideocrella luteorostrata]
MSSVQTRSSTSAGTKVDVGKNAPVVQEGAGRVENDSLAAESYRADGKFAENRNAEPEAPSNAANKSSGGGVEGSQGDAAPTYINSQLASDPSGPHGKNLKEGGFDHQQVFSGQRRAFNSEPGSINDPGRLAEAKFERKDAATPRAAFNKDTNELTTNTPFDNLDRKADA